MKLHLPVRLFKAVLTGLLSVACFTVNSGTVWAEESSVSILSEGKTPSVSISSPGAAALTSTPDGTLIIMNLDGGHLYGASYSTFDVVADMQIDSMRISDGYTRAVYNFNGDISGSGVFERTSAAKSDYQTYVFSGDMSAYSGTMCLSKANDNSTLKFVNNTSGTGAITIAAGNTLVVSGATMNNSSIISSGVLEVWDTATFTHDISVNGTLSLGRGSALVNNGTFTFADTALINLQHATYTTDTAGNRTYQLFSASGSGSSNLSSLTAANITGISTGGWEWTLNDDGSITAIDVGRTLTYVGGTMTWNTSSGNAVFSSAGSAVAFASGDKVKFSGNSTVSLGEDITTREMTVGAGVTVVLTTTEHTLNAESVVVDGTLQLKNGGQNGALTGDITVRGQLDFAAGDVTGWSSSMGIKSINILKDGNLHISVGGNQNQTAAGLVIGLQGGTITGVSNANLDLAYGGSQYGHSSISAHAAEGATSDTPTVSSISGTSLSLRQKATTISVAENARLDISSVIKERSSTDVLNGEGALASGKIAGLTKTGAGELRLTGANTYTQNTTVAEGTLTLADGGSLASSSITVNDGAVFRLDAAEELAVSASGSLGGSGTLIKTGLGSASLGSLADSFAGRIELQQGSLSLNSPLVISSGRELALGMNGAVLNSDLYLGDGLLSTNLSDAGVSTSLNDHSLILSGGTVLMLQGAFHKVTDLFTGVGSLLGADGNELVLDSSNNAAALYFDLSRPGMGFWTNSTLVLSSSGTLQLVKPSNISIPAGYTEVLVDHASDIARYSSSATDVAFRLTTDVTVDGHTSELMTSSADSRYFTSNSVDNLQSLTFSNATERLFYVSSNEKLEFHGLKIVTFIGNRAYSSSSAYGGAIYGGENSTIRLSSNGSVTFIGNTADGNHVYGGAIYGSTITLNDNGSVEFIGNDVYGNDVYGGAIYGSTIRLSSNGSVTFSENTASSSYTNASGGAIYGDDYSTITLSDNGSVTFSGNTVDGGDASGGAIYGGTITLSGNDSVTFSGNTASSSYSYSSYGGAIYGSTIELSGNESVTFSGNRASSSSARGGAIYGGTITLSGNEIVTFSGNRASSSSASGGAIYGDDYSTITLSDNGSVTFSGNTASYYGGAIDGSTIELSDNGSVTFSGNTASSSYASGGAIYGSTIELSGNGSVEFSGNRASSSSDSYACGGAIDGRTITLSGNDSVTFSGNTASSSSDDAYGGAIYGSTIELSGNGSVEFSENTASSGGAIDGSTIELSGNGSVEFSGNTASSSSNDAYGGAIDGSTITLSGNGSVTFSGNKASDDGGAIYGSTIELSGNGSVTFSGNTAEYGGAIYGSTIELSENGSVTFSGNTASSSSTSSSAYAYGGAIYGSTIELSGNESVTFSGNTVDGGDAYGGAIYGGTITLSGNDSVTFSGNTASDDGGAIYGSTIELSGNESVTFSGNTVSSSDSVARGGAIYGYSHLSIQNNDSVLFEKNAEKYGSSYCLRSIYAGGRGDVISLSAAEGKSIEFRDSVYIASGSTVNLNADYTDADGVVHKQTGDIIFTGAYTEQHLNELLAADGLIRTATAEEILNSRTTVVDAMTNLYGGRLCVEEGAVYKGYGITAHEGSAATVLVKDATLNHAGYDLVFHAGTTLELVGDNAASAKRLQMHTGSSLVFRENASMALDGVLNLQGTGTLLLEDGNLSAQKIDGTGGISITGGRLELQDDTDALAVDGAVSISNTTLSGNWCGEGLTVDGVSVAADAEISLNNLTIKSVLSNEGTLVLGGEVSIAREDFGPAGGDVQYSAGSSGYRSVAHGYTLVEGCGQSSAAADAKWLITENGAEQDYQSYSYTDGMLTAYIERDITTYWVNSEVTYDSRSDFDTANTLVLNGGGLTLAAALGDNLTKGIRAEADSSLNMGAGLAESDDSVSVNVSVGVTVTVDEPVIGHGTLLKSGDGILSVKELADSFAGSLVLQQGMLHMAEPLVISKGRELHVGKTDAVLDTTLQLSDGLLCMDFSGTGETVSLNNTNLHLQGETGLQLRDAGKEDGRVYDLFTDIYGLKDSNGNALVLSADNNAAALYFDAERPGTGFWKNATLQLTDAGTLQLIRYTDITIPTGYARTVVMDEPSDFTRYAGLTQDVAFRLAADVAFDASATVMTNLAASRYFTSASADATAAIAFRNSENRMFYVKENETLIMKALRAVTFEDIAVSADEAISGGAIYVSDNSGITLEDNGAVIFSGTTLTANGAVAQGGALYAGATSQVVLNGNGSVEFLKNSVVGSSSHGGAMYADSLVLLSNNNGVIFRDNSSVSRGGAIEAGAELTLLDNGSVDFSGNTSGQGGAINAAANVVLEANGVISFSGNEATSGSGAAIYTTGDVVLTDNGSVEFSGNVASGSGGAIYGSTATVSGNQGSVVFCENTTTSGSGAAIYTTGDVVLTDNGSVEFSGNTASSNGGAVYGSQVTVSGNQGSVVFSENTTTSGSGAAIYTTGDVVLTDNGSVEFSGNTAVTGGGAIYGSTVTVSDNIGAVSFIGNVSERSGSSSSLGGAIYGSSQVTFSGNNSVVFKENSAYYRGGAIYTPGTVRLTGNGSVEFRDNVASIFDGGAIYAKTVELCDNAGGIVFTGNKAAMDGGGAIYASSSIILSGNGSVEFSENTAKYGGGAIRSSATVTINNHADAVLFRGNTASSSSYGGGAVYASSGVTLSHNGSVEFCANSSVGYGGAIYTSGSVTIAGNDEVTFARNVEKNGSTYRLRSLYLAGDSSADKLTLSAGKGQSISFYDSVYMGATGSVALNADYTDAEGVTQKASGTILFSGATTEDDLKTAKNGVAGTEEEILNSRTSEINSAATLYGGTLQVQDKAVLKLNGGLTVAAGSTATMQVQEGATLNLSSMTIAKDAQASIEVSGGSAMTASGQVSVAEGGLSTLKVQDSRVDWGQSSLALSSGNRIELQDNAEFNLFSMTIAKDAQASIEVSGGSAMTASGRVSVAAGGLSSLKVQDSRVDWGQSSLALSTGNRIELQDNAEFNLSSMTIAKDAQASIELSGGSVMTASGQVSVTAGGSASLQVQKSELNLNGGLTVAAGSTASLQVQDGATLNLSSMTIAKDAQASIELSGGSVMTASGQVRVAAGGSATLKVQESEVNLGSNALALTSGSLVELQNGASLSLIELTVAAGAELKAGGYIAPVAEAAKPVAFSLEGIESDTPIVNTGSVNHVEGNLRLSGGSTLNLQDSYLTVTGDLVLDVTAESEKVVVDLMPGIAKDEFSQVVLFEVAGTVTFGENGTASDSEVVYYQFAEDYFTGDWISQDTWLVYDRSTNLVYLEGVNLIAAVPEPTTSMLGLMGLVAFTLRRRRK